MALRTPPLVGASLDDPHLCADDVHANKAARARTLARLGGLTRCYYEWLTGIELTNQPRCCPGNTYGERGHDHAGAGNGGPIYTTYSHIPWTRNRTPPTADVDDDTTHYGGTARIDLMHVVPGHLLAYAQSGANGSLRLHATVYVYECDSTGSTYFWVDGDPQLLFDTSGIRTADLTLTTGSAQVGTYVSGSAALSSGFGPHAYLHMTASHATVGESKIEGPLVALIGFGLSVSS